MIFSSTVRGSRLVILAASLSLVAVACSSANGDDLGSIESPAKIGTDKVDCFPSCKQADYDKLIKGGLAGACKTLKDGWKDAVKDPAWPGWDDKKPICIGHKDEIKPRTDCNRLVDAPNWNECNNELMLNCAKAKQPGFGPIILVPPSKDGFPPPLDPPTITDQELACLTQWKCPTKTIKPKSGSVQLSAYQACSADGTCAVCDDSWIIEEPAPTPNPTPATPTPTPEITATPQHSAFDF